MLAEQLRPTPRPIAEILAYSNSRMVERHAADNGISIEVAERRFHAFKQFMVVCAQKPGKKVTSPEIDTVWHSFLLFTRDYRAFCNHYLGRFIEHQPFEAPAPGAYLETRQAAEALFGALDLECWPVEGKGALCTSGCDD